MQQPIASSGHGKLLLLCLAILSSATAAAMESRDTDSGRHHHLQHALSRHLPARVGLARSRHIAGGSVDADDSDSTYWRAAQRRCAKRGGELPRLTTPSTSSSSSSAAAAESLSVEALTQQVAHWPAGGCYWLGNRYSRSLRPLVENPYSRWSRRSGGCLCARVVVEAGDGERSRRFVVDDGYFGERRVDDDTEARRSTRAQLRLHLTSCRRALPFRCHLIGTKTTAATTKSLIRTKSSTGTPTPATTRAAPVLADEFLPADEADPDEALDHDKFPEIEAGPDGHPKGWLPPWHALTSPTRPAPPTSSGLPAATATVVGMSIDADNNNNNNKTLLGSETLAHMWQEQRSEFITLVVLYTIVGVICTVLLALCLVRCCRGYCGKAKVRYVRQVDADDIPRFMPSSWA